MLGINVKLENKKITLINVYGPNTDNPQFFDKVMECCDSFDNEDIIICGDFNLIIDPSLDCDNYTNINNPRSRQKVLKIIRDRNLVDTFREKNNNSKRYTWRRKNPIKQARLDLFLITNNLLPSLERANIETSYRSDHSIASIDIKLSNFKKGRGYWKFNKTLLEDSEYITLVKNKINTLKERYAVPVYNFENLHDIQESDLHLSINDQLFLEVLLMEIRGDSIKYASYKHRKRREKYDKVKM